MTRPVRRGGIAAALAVLAAACDVVDPTGYSRELAYIEFYDSPVEIVVPATATVEEAITVTVRTYGGGCTSRGDTQVAVSGAVAELRPYDVTRTDGDCPDIMRQFVHEAEVTFDQPGTAQVRVHGRTAPGGATMVEIRTVTVQPAG